MVETLTEQRQEKLNRLRVAEREKEAMGIAMGIGIRYRALGRTVCEALDGPRKEAEAWVTGEAQRLELQSLLAQSQVQASKSQLGSLEDEHKAMESF